MSRAAAQRRLRLAVEGLARRDVNADDVSEAIHAFGHVIADLTDQPVKLAILCGEELDAVEALLRRIVELESKLGVLNA